MYIEEYEEQFFEGLERGEAKAKGIKKALDHALEQQDVDAALQLYYLFMNEDVMHGNSYQAIILFPEYVAYFEDHPDKHDEYNHDVMWTYKWIIANVLDFPQIPLSQIESLYEQYKDFCKKFNYNLRTYYGNICFLIQVHLGKDGVFCGMTAKQAHSEMMKIPRDNLSDCVACETSSEVSYLINNDEPEEKIIKKAKGLIEGKLTCAEQPHCALANIAEYYLEHGDLTNATKFAEKAYHLINRDYANEDNLNVKKSICMTVFSHSNPNKAIKILKNVMRFVPENSNYNDLFEIYRSTYYFMYKLEERGATHIRLRLPFRDEDIITEDNVYEITALKEYFYNKAKELAVRFDERNGNSLFMERLDKINIVDEENFSYSQEMPDYPLLTYIRENLDDGFLPENFSLPCPDLDDDKEPFADGALDGIMLIHQRNDPQELGELEGIIRRAADGDDICVIDSEKYFEETGNRMILLIDAVQDFIIENQKDLNAQNMFGFGVDLAVGSNNKEAVKLGLSILALFGDFNEKLTEAILELAACNEFTLFAMWAVAEVENKNELTFEMAKHADGWGRILTVHYLEPETDEIKQWLLKEGIKNTVYPGYSAITCFEKADVMTLLENGLNDDNFTDVEYIITFLILDGPTIGIKAFAEDEERIMDMFITAAENRELDEFQTRGLQLILENYENENICNRIINMGIEPLEEESDNSEDSE